MTERKVRDYSALRNGAPNLEQQPSPDQPANASAPPERKMTPAEEAEWAIEKDEALIRRLRAEGRTADRDVVYKERELQAEPLEAKIQRYRREEVHLEELKASEVYLRSVESSKSPPVRPSEQKTVERIPDGEITDRKARIAARIKALDERHEAFEKNLQAGREGQSQSRNGRT